MIVFSIAMFAVAIFAICALLGVETMDAGGIGLFATMALLAAYAIKEDLDERL